MDRDSSFRSRAWCTALLLALTAPGPASAAETKGFVLSWFNIAEYFDPQGRDCPHGTNPGPEVFFRRELSRLGRPAEEIDAYVKNFGNLAGGPGAAPVQMRGRVNGIPADVYAHPETAPDPNMFLVEGLYGHGFNLDGKNKPGDFIDPDTGETGVDNQIFRVFGCIQGTRQHAPAERAPLIVSKWNIVAEAMPALLLEISGIDDPQSDDDVTVKILRARERITPGILTPALPGMTYRSDPNPRWRATLRGRIRDGVVTTETADVSVAVDPLIMPEYNFKKARLRLRLNSDGSLSGLLGGYHAWYDFYWSYGQGAWLVEATEYIDLPGLYHALRKSADASPAPNGGANTAISAAFHLDGTPAFIVHE